MRQRKRLLYIGNKLAVHGKPPAGIDSLSVKLEAEGYTVITASSKRNKIFRMLDMVFSTIRYRNRVELVLIDTYSTQNFYYAVIVAMLCRLFKLPYIPILHGGNLPNRLKNSKGLSNKLFGKALSNVAPSKYMMHQFKDAGFHNIIYIPNAIEIKNYPFHLRQSITPKLLWVRSFSEIYNPLLALEVLEMLKIKGIDASLCMVGPDKDGTLTRCKKIASELKLPIRFTGMLQKKEWIVFSKDFDIFINTTNFDNMPVSVMEAMALGLPVISTNVGGMPFLIEDEVDGILVAPNNTEVFVKATEDLCDNPLKAQELAKNARTKMEGFDWGEVKHNWIKLLDT
ncbi:glycosyltransferase family 4 protein [Aequorivita lipolytica]|uniref:Glycosyltransferase family 4 protein n=1 Tax=Aequorivita lipolytica TaxID=153267 RepID=A0A5C6YNC8_9FLAO|nr:glycosyltransferase family 4 protein [Aequorivita lipolytica]TXD68811.1 glycosyltransferase family 4 protein [Aequorivita lipolytica]SRX52062.1 Glycogen synthase [Aequorivita lipolytica]